MTLRSSTLTYPDDEQIEARGFVDESLAGIEVRPFAVNDEVRVSNSEARNDLRQALDLAIPGLVQVDRIRHYCTCHDTKWYVSNGCFL